MVDWGKNHALNSFMPKGSIIIWSVICFWFLSTRRIRFAPINNVETQLHRPIRNRSAPRTTAMLFFYVKIIFLKQWAKFTFCARHLECTSLRCYLLLVPYCDTVLRPCYGSELSLCIKWPTNLQNARLFLSSRRILNFTQQSLWTTTGVPVCLRVCEVVFKLQKFPLSISNHGLFV